MTIAFALFLVVHGLIHLMGFAKAFGYADLPDLTQPISTRMGLAWLVAAALFVAAGVLVMARPRVWWLVGALAVLVSMAVIVPSWRDAKVGALANVVAVVGIAFGIFAFGPTSLRAAYDHDVTASAPTASATPRLVRDADLTRLPAPVQRYLRVTGVVGQPWVDAFSARMHGRIRSAPDASWMPFSAEQHTVLGAAPARFFYMTATRALVPMQGYHRFTGRAASMEVRAAAIVPVVRLAGPEMTQSETVTFFNDMCVLAPASLLDPRIAWDDEVSATERQGDDAVREGGRAVRARFTHLGRTVAATLFFDGEGRLRDFVSDDRYAAAHGATMTRQRWSTPLRAYKAFGPAHLASAGEARYHDGSGSWAYIEMVIDHVAYVPAPMRASSR